jgi:hypothetical protein
MRNTTLRDCARANRKGMLDSDWLVGLKETPMTRQSICLSNSEWPVFISYPSVFNSNARVKRILSIKIL